MGDQLANNMLCRCNRRRMYGPLCQFVDRRLFTIPSLQKGWHVEENNR